MKKWRYIALIPVIIIAVALLGFGIRYLAWCYYFQKNPMTEVGGTKADIFYAMEEILYVPDSLPENLYFDSLSLSVTSGRNHFISIYKNKNDSKYLNVGVDILDMEEDYNFVSSSEISGVPVHTYTDKETGDYIMVYKTEVSIFFVTGNIPKEQLDTVFNEYMNYLIKSDIAK